MNEILKPDDEFVDRLEWQLRSEMRRQRWRQDSSSGQPRRRWLSAVALIVLSLGVGFASATAAQQLEGRAQRRYLLARADGAVQLAELRLAIAREQAEYVELRAQQGIIGAEDLASVRLQAVQVEVDLVRVTLDREEIELSGVAVRDELTAPRVRGRDFVTERLENRLRLNDAMIDTLVAYRKRSELVTDETELAGLDAEIRSVRQRRRQIVAEIQLRADFLSGSVSGEAIVAQRQLEQARQHLERAEDVVRIANLELKKARDREEVGIIPEHEVRVAEFQVASAELDAKLARLEIQMAREQLER